MFHHLLWCLKQQTMSFDSNVLEPFGIQMSVLTRNFDVDAIDLSFISCEIKKTGKPHAMAFVQMRTQFLNKAMKHAEICFGCPEYMAFPLNSMLYDPNLYMGGIPKLSPAEVIIVNRKKPNVTYIVKPLTYDCYLDVVVTFCDENFIPLEGCEKIYGVTTEQFPQFLTYHPNLKN